jgi:hypothetical protein
MLLIELADGGRFTSLNFFSTYAAIWSLRDQSDFRGNKPKILRWKRAVRWPCRDDGIGKASEKSIRSQIRKPISISRQVEWTVKFLKTVVSCLVNWISI